MLAVLTEAVVRFCSFSMVLVSTLIHTFWRKFRPAWYKKRRRFSTGRSMYLPPIETIVVILILASFSVFVNSFHRVFQNCQKMSVLL